LNVLASRSFFSSAVASARFDSIRNEEARARSSRESVVHAEAA